VYASDTKKWINAQKAFYSINDKTPMNYGFGAYEKAIENSINYSEMKLKMLRGENMTNPKIRKKILGH
jgi:nitrous oxide reductase accessory protein NosL